MIRGHLATLDATLQGSQVPSICISLILDPSLRLFDYWAGAEGTTNKQFGRRQEISIFKGVDPWVASWNVIFPEEVVILMSLLLESVELPLDNCWTSSTGRPPLRCSRALAA